MAEIIVLGVILSAIFYEITDICPGGIVVPGLMVLYIGQPIRLLYTLIISLISYWIILLLSKKMIIYGKRRFVLLILISFILQAIVSFICGFFIPTVTDTMLLLVSYTCSGIIANNIYKQGAVKTISSLALIVGMLEGIILLFTAIGWII